MGNANKAKQPVLLKLLYDPNRFKKLKDGWVRDKLLGVEWGPTSEKEMNFKDAQSYCKKLKARLPEINELQSLVDYSKRSPAIKQEIFPDQKSRWYWSGTTIAGYSGLAWVVVFGSGGVVVYGKGGSNYVRPVRSSQ